MRKKARTLHAFLFLAAGMAFFSISAGMGWAAQMGDYCDLPPYVVQNTPPNIMILLDNSGSMYNYAYYDNGYDCSSPGTPCTGFDPTQTYEGYFNPDLWYQFSGVRFVPDPNNPSNHTIGSSVSNPDSLNDWDGNFLNWLTMRRMDMIRWALTGGNFESDSSNQYSRLIGVGLDSPSRGAWKEIPSALDQNAYTPYSNATPVMFQADFPNNPKNPTPYGQFGVYNASTCGSTGCSGTALGQSPYNVKVQVPVPVEGVLQKVVGGRARVGLATYGNPWNQPPSSPNGNGDGGMVITSVSATSLQAVINQVNSTQPTANTPLAEALFTVAGYFAQTKQPFTSPTYSFNFGDPGPYDYSGSGGTPYVVNNDNDPFNYNSGGQPAYPVCAQNFVLLLTDGEPCEDGDLPPPLLNYAQGKSPFVCSNTGDLGDGSLDGSCPAICSTGYPPSHYSNSQCPQGSVQFGPESSFTTCKAGNEAAGIEDVALWMHTTDLRPDLSGNQTLTLYTVFAFGEDSTLLKYASINGGFQDLNRDNEPTPGLPNEWSSDGSGNPNNYFNASQGSELYNALSNAFSGMLKRASSGTAASILAPSQGSGANLTQAVYYPKRNFLNNVINWTGSLRDLWYYVDPFFHNSNIMEETDLDKYLTLGPGEDDDVTFSFDASLGRTMINRYYSNANGSPGAQDTATGSPDYFENLRSIWGAGLGLWETSPSARTIYTSVDGQSLIGFDTANDGLIGPYLDTAGITNGTDSVIEWTEGYDLPGYDPAGNGTADYRSRTVSEVVSGSESSGVWKLGDIVDSTPQITASQPLETSYYDTYGDTSYWQFTNSASYKGRGTVYVGGNDGMLHAFELGLINSTGPFGDGNVYTKAEITGSALGSERWAFIPENVLPYLKYITDPNYCHLYTVDLTPFVFDASTGGCGGANGDYWDCQKSAGTWRTILIGGMRLGGASACSPGCADCSTPSGQDWVNAPSCINGKSTGWSEYFALDVTDENNPKLLWEFTSPELGFATSGPAIVRINAAGDSSGNLDNGHWFAVFGSGPTGAIETTNHEFEGRSDQPLKYFVFDLANGPGPNNANVTTISTNIVSAFSGDLFNSTNDSGLQSGLPNYEDDAVYGGYTALDAGAGTWTQGGVGRILTHDDPNPADWTYLQVISGIGPVTSGVARLQDNNAGKLWLFFGTGRYYYFDSVLGDSKSNNPTNPNGVDDLSSQREIFGVTDPCYTGAGSEPFDPNCSTVISGLGSLNNATNLGNISTGESWYINLDTGPAACDSSDTNDTCGSERALTTPVASTTGAVYFTTFKPYDQECGIGGKTYLWGTEYNSGGALAGTMAGTMGGTALLQLSTGSIQQVNLSSAFTGEGGRRSAAFEGMPPTSSGMEVFTPPQPVKKMLYIREEK